MGVWLREWIHKITSNAIKYEIHHFETEFPLVDNRCVDFMPVTINGESKNLACLGCSEEVEEEHYYRFIKQLLITKLRPHYPEICTACVGEVANKLTDIVKIANAAHRCPETTVDRYSTNHSVYVGIEPRDNDALGAKEFIIFEKEKPEVVMEDVVPMMKPATRASIVELFEAAKVASMIEEGVCGICMEEIDKTCLFSSNGLMMPCKHVFHRFCLVQWLNTDHSCPICRYRIPAAQYYDDLNMFQ